MDDWAVDYEKFGGNGNNMERKIRMNSKERMYAVIGGIVGAVVTLAVCSFALLGTQSGENGIFDVVTCRELKVVDSEGKGVNIQSRHSSGYMVVDGRDGGKVMISGISPGSSGPFIHVFGKENAGSAGISLDENGGRVEIFGKGKSGLQAEMGITNDGNGEVSMWGRSGFAAMGVGKYGGKAEFYGPTPTLFFARMGDDWRLRATSSCAAIGINEHGNGGVTTWGKNGNRLAELK